MNGPTRTASLAGRATFPTTSTGPPISRRSANCSIVAHAYLLSPPVTNPPSGWAGSSPRQPLAGKLLRTTSTCARSTAETGWQTSCWRQPASLTTVSIRTGPTALGSGRKLGTFRASRGVEMRDCKTCGVSFTPRGNRQLHCWAHSTKNPDRVRWSGVKQTCSTCLVEFMPTHHLQTVCSDRCRVLYKSFDGIRSRARERHIVFNLSAPQYVQLKQARCHYCRQPASAIDRNCSVDRLDSAGGYTPDNTVPCCLSCNTRKNENSPQAFMSSLWLDAIAESTGSPGGEA